MEYKDFRRQARLDMLSDKKTAYSEIYEYLNLIKNGHFEYKSSEQDPESLVKPYVYIYDSGVLFDMYVVEDANEKYYTNTLNLSSVIYRTLDEILAKYHYRWSLLGDGFIKEYIRDEFKVSSGADIDMSYIISTININNGI